jgi:hypothetical protein
VNARGWLHIPDNAEYHDTPTLNDDVDEVYQEEESPPSLIIDPSAGLDDLVGDADDIELCIVVMQKQKPIKKKFDCLDQGLDYQIMMLMNLSTSITFIHNFFHFVYFLLILY